MKGFAQKSVTLLCALLLTTALLAGSAFAGDGIHHDREREMYVVTEADGSTHEYEDDEYTWGRMPASDGSEKIIIRVAKNKKKVAEHLVKNPD